MVACRSVSRATKKKRLDDLGDVPGLREREGGRREPLTVAARQLLTQQQAGVERLGRRIVEEPGIRRVPILHGSARCEPFTKARRRRDGGLTPLGCRGRVELVDLDPDLLRTRELSARDLS